MRVRVNIGSLPSLTGVTILRPTLTPGIPDKNHLDAVHSRITINLDTVGKTASKTRMERNATRSSR